MKIRFYNTLTHRQEPFEPIEPPNVTMYNCGPTVYDYAHIGNFRAFVFADVLRRFLELTGHNVHQVMNLTDVGHMTEDALADGGGQDKMQVAIDRMKVAKKSGQVPDNAVGDPNNPYDVAQYFIDAFLKDARDLGLKIADEYPDQMPRATKYVEQMQELIKKLIEREHAYVADDGAVYYSVQSFPDYGRLSGNTLDKLRGGAGGRVQDRHQANKRHPGDFLLWKPDPSHMMKWDSPWGEGYPGWHIECSAMARAVLGRDTIDIHTGGEDNIFPHHECEIAQSSGATGKPFARFWMHTRFLLVEGKKMSKSKGNFYTVRDVLEGKVTGNPVDPAVLRYELLKTHYRSNMNFTAEGLKASGQAVQKIRRLAEDLYQKASDKTAKVDLSHPVLSAFNEALAEDLNMSKALAVLFESFGTLGKSPDIGLVVIKKINEVIAAFDPLNIIPQQQIDVGPWPDESMGGTVEISQAPQITLSQMKDERDHAAARGDMERAQRVEQERVKRMCQAIDAARSEKDYERADAQRKQLEDDGYEVMTTKEGTVAMKKLA